MDIVDEVTLMDYFTGCSTLSTSNLRCDPTMSLFWLAPWLSYANFLLTAKNRTVLIDVGVAMDPANATTGHPNYPNNHWISSELDPNRPSNSCCRLRYRLTRRRCRARRSLFFSV